MAFGAGLHAFLRAPDRLWACAALVASGLALVVWWFVVGPVVWCLVVGSLVVPLLARSFA